MSETSQPNYFDRLLEKGVSRSIITGEQRDTLAANWRRWEKDKSFSQLYTALHVLSLAGIALGLLYAIPEVLKSSLFHSAISTTAGAGRYLFRDFTRIAALPTIKAGVFFLCGIAANYVGTWLEKKRSPAGAGLVRAVYITGALLHAVATAYVIMQGVIFRGWEELEVTSVSFWCVIPLVMTVLSGGRPLFYQLLTGLIIGMHSLAYFSNVSGNTFIAFDISTSVILISFAHWYKARDPRLAACIKYMSLTIICFLLYCTGFVWDLPAILEFRGYVSPDALYPSRVFLAALFIVTVAVTAATYFLVPGQKNRSDRLFALLLLITLVFAYFASCIIMGYISVGHVFDLFGGAYKQSIFSVNALFALLFSWIIWFLWCLWVLVESKASRNVLLAQIGVTAMLGSIEIRYVEICRNFSFAAGLVMLPIALILATASARILSKWLRDLLAPSEGRPVAE